jgi:putative copper resistance protein D
VAASTTWAALCAACHGPAGEGLDTASPNHQHGSGTSLIDADTIRRSDGDLYWVLSNGLGGTDMPAFDVALSDQQRWSLIGWIRQAQQNAPTEP